MKAITLWQPWASLIASGWKTIETRRHARFACLVGSRIAIHAGKHFDRTIFEIWPTRIPRHGFTEAPRGVVLCTALVTEARWLFGEGQDDALCDTARLFGLTLADVRRLYPPVAAKGHQGIWNWKEKP